MARSLKGRAGNLGARHVSTIPPRIIYHLRFIVGLRHMRQSMTGLIHGESVFPVSLTLITATLLLVVGAAAIVSMVFQVGPFG
jgi:putative membrane protein